MSATAKSKDLLSDETPMYAYVAGFLTYLKSEKRASANTIRNYDHALRLFQDFLSAHLGGAPNRSALEKLETRDFRAFLAERRMQGLEPQSIKLDLSAIRSFYGFLRRRYGVENDAIGAMRGPKPNKRLPRPINADDADALIGLVETSNAAPWVKARDVAVFVILYGLGLRISEALGLKWADAPFGETLRIDGKGNKTRLAPVLPVARDAVASYVKLCPFGGEKDDPLFFSIRGKPLSPRAVQRTMELHRQSLGLPDTATPHALRHAFATQMLSSGGDLRAVQELLGHASIAATQRYTKIDAEALLSVYENAHPRS